MSPAPGAYVAPWWLPGAHLQTIVAALGPAPRIAWSRERWETPDGDCLDVDWAGEERSPRLLVLFHGLEGSSKSHYGRSLAAQAALSGWRFALPHFRGCSGEPNRLPRAYHSGDSDEAQWLLERFAARAAELHAAGISLGGNVLLKWLGERGGEARRWVRRAAAVSAPLDLAASGAALDRGFNKHAYTRHFLATLKRKSLVKLERFPGLYDAERVRRASTLREFDDVVTAPLHGFLGTDDYWARASSAPLLGRIRVPTLLLNARNDPFLPERALERAASLASSAVLTDFPPAGGHAGFAGRGNWLARRIFEFLSAP